MGQIQYSEKYFDDTYEYRYTHCSNSLIFFVINLVLFLNRFFLLLFRHVVLPPEVAKLLPKNRLLSEVSNYSLCWFLWSVESFFVDLCCLWLIQVLYDCVILSFLFILFCVVICLWKWIKVLRIVISFFLIFFWNINGILWCCFETDGNVWWNFLFRMMRIEFWSWSLMQNTANRY